MESAYADLKDQYDASNRNLAELQAKHNAEYKDAKEKNDKYDHILNVVVRCTDSVLLPRRIKNPAKANRAQAKRGPEKKSRLLTQWVC